MSLELEDRGKALENEYFRKREQELLEKMKAKIAAEESTPLDLNCPKCDGKLHEVTFEQVAIDVCDKCQGIWLDAGELALVSHREGEKEGWFSRFFG
jgi:Zn finger protein HypA/HybF involved in hydrogenase expression